MQTSTITNKVNAEIDKIIKNAYDKALNLLKEHSKLVHVLVEKLLENGMLSKLELEEIIKSVEGSGE
jgi:ATP-dependent Zn protease